MYIYIYICIHICACTHLHTSENECMMSWHVHVSYVKAHTWCWVNQALQHLTHQTQNVGMPAHRAVNPNLDVCVNVFVLFSLVVESIWKATCRLHMLELTSMLAVQWCALTATWQYSVHQVFCNMPGTTLSTAQLWVHQVKAISAVLHQGFPAEF